MRSDGRDYNQIREVEIIPDFLSYPLGSVLIGMGNTKVLCSASMDEKVPSWMEGQERGWVTAEYSMLPASNRNSRSARESSRGKVGGRTHEIQRLIGRSLRGSVDLKDIAGKTFWIDCDVLQADGGTRTASITGGYIALLLAFNRLKEMGKLEKIPFIHSLASISAGMVEGKPLLDLNYHEDSQADVDMNFVITGQGQLIEVQGTAEGQCFSKTEMDQMFELALQGTNRLLAIIEELRIG